MKKRKEGIFKKICHWLHLWVGVLCGSVLFVVALTGCLYSFKEEIQSITESYRYIKQENKPILSPYQLKEIAKKHIYVTPADSANLIYGIAYEKGKAAMLAYKHYEKGYTGIYLNPYTGSFIHKEYIDEGFFEWVLAGHTHLWLPEEIGRQIVGWATFLFIFITITGLVLWLPKKWNKRNIKTILTIKWKARFFRINHDLHNVLGFYSCSIALILAITGLTWSFEWFGSAYYKIISGGEHLNEWPVPESPEIIPQKNNPDEILWASIQKDYPIGKEGIFLFDFPTTPTGAYRMGYNPETTTYYKRHFRYFSQDGRNEISGGGLYEKRYENSSIPEKLYRMSFDIHVGGILGLPGKIFIFIISFIICTLPVTGIIIWYRKGFKSPRIINK